MESVFFVTVSPPLPLIGHEASLFRYTPIEGLLQSTHRLVVKANDGLASVPDGSQVYVTFDSHDTVTRIDVMQREELPPLVVPDLPWLPFPMTDGEE